MAAKPILTRWIFVLLLFFGGLLSCLQLSINDNALDLLPRQAVLGDIQTLKNMGLVDRLFITVTADGDEGEGLSGNSALLRSVDNLGSNLAKSDLFSFVLYRLPQGYEMGLMGTVQKSLPYLLDDSDYARLREKISPDSIAASLKQSILLLNSPAGIGLKQHIQKDPLGFSLLGLEKLNHLRSEFSMTIEDGYFMSRDKKSCLIIAEATQSLTDSDGATAVDNFLQQAYATSLESGIGVTVIGSLPHTLANARTIQSDLQILLPVATLLLVLLLWATLRSFKVFLVLGIPFMAAPVAIGLTAMVYGELSRLALGFGIVLLGIAVDFAIHLFVAGSSSRPGRKLGYMGKPIFYATLTSSAVFVVLLFSDVPSHRQMATLALCGLLMAVLFSVLLVPSIGSGREKDVSKVHHSFSLQRGKSVLLLIWVLVLVLGIFCWSQLRYNGDLRVLDVPDEAVIADENFFSEVWGEKGEQAFVLAEAEDIDELLEMNYKVYRVLQEEGHFNNMQSLAPLLPSTSLQKARLARWQEFWQIHRQEFQDNVMETAQELGFSSRAFAPFFTWLDSEPERIHYESYLGSAMAPLVQSMVKERGELTPCYYAMTTVGITGDSLERLIELTINMEGVSVVANAKWRALVEKELRRDVLFLSLAAGFVVIVLAAMQFRNPVAVCAVLAPVFSALSVMSIYSCLSSGELNMMHLIMGIMVIGLSVDYGIFTVCSKQDKHHRDSGFAVSICAGSSLIGFGVLAFAGHPALHALGVTVLAGIGAAWPTALLISPLILELDTERENV